MARATQNWHLLSLFASISDNRCQLRRRGGEEEEEGEEEGKGTGTVGLQTSARTEA